MAMKLAIIISNRE